jgi:hypothetical protein
MSDIVSPPRTAYAAPGATVPTDAGEPVTGVESAARFGAMVGTGAAGVAGAVPGITSF